MQRVFEKIIERLKEVKCRANRHYNYGEETSYKHAIEIVNQVAEEYGENASISANGLKLIEEMAEEIENLYGKETELSNMAREYLNGYGSGWIPCSERLPQEDEPEEALCEIVNITLKNGTVTVGWCNRYLEQWFVLDEHCDYPISRKYEDVLAWQPLPEPYKAESEE